MDKRALLFEIGCEELPQSAQQTLPKALTELFIKAFSDASLSFNHVKTFITPRRVAILVSGLSTQQPPQKTERQGPNFEQAYDKNNTPTLACLGFAKSCGVSLDELIIKDTPKGRRVVCYTETPSVQTVSLLPLLINQVVLQLPLSKSMRWGNQTQPFFRPIHWVVLLFGNEVIPAELFGIKTGRETMGHRFHHPKPIHLSRAEDYNITLYSQGYVITDSETRKNVIKKSILQQLESSQHAVIDANLLDEVTALVEWPVVLKGSFKEKFLSVPKEALTMAMQSHQKCFPIVNQKNELLPYFFLVSNIQSKNEKVVIQGNERVIHARLSDAAFFYEKDIKQSLVDRLPKLEHVIFQEKLGSLGDKTRRIVNLADKIAAYIHADILTVKNAATFCKCDLVTEMVGEFPNLQGIMGYYYALHDQQSHACAEAIKEHYLPKFSGDQLPTTKEAVCIALADRIDTLVGIIGIYQTPMGDKDPFAIRRIAHGIVRLCIEKALSIDLLEILQYAHKNFSVILPNHNVVSESFQFIMARLKSWYLEQRVSVEIFEAVAACHPSSLWDFDRRVKAVMHFQRLPEATSLAAANKRVNNILKKTVEIKKLGDINCHLFEYEAEHILSKQLSDLSKLTVLLYEKADYEKALSVLSTLKTPIDHFFDEVMIMVDDENKRKNRLALLVSIRDLFTKVADISLL